MLISIKHLPAVNAVLNGTSFILLLLAFYFIKRRMIKTHRGVMLAAFGTSILFLVSYLTYHYQVGTVHFMKQGWIRPVYFSILATHTVLAASIVPLAIITLSRGLRANFGRHVRIARWTLPIWLYVSVTGVVIYFLLYQL
ncbi:MAG: DUF420 domain-containing protein [Calditrichia bacterium]